MSASFIPRQVCLTSLVHQKISLHQKKTILPPNVQKETKFNRSLALGANLRSGVVEALKIDCS